MTSASIRRRRTAHRIEARSNCGIAARVAFAVRVALALLAAVGSCGRPVLLPVV